MAAAGCLLRPWSQICGGVSETDNALVSVCPLFTFVPTTATKRFISLIMVVQVGRKIERMTEDNIHLGVAAQLTELDAMHHRRSVSLRWRPQRVFAGEASNDLVGIRAVGKSRTSSKRKRAKRSGFAR